MSKDSVKQMFGKMEKDAGLKGKYAELMQAHQIETEKALANKLVELGKTSGFAFSKEDLMAARAELIDKANSNKELADGDLANVAGGASRKENGIVVSVMFIWMGACAVASLIEPKENTPIATCADYFSTSHKQMCNEPMTGK